MSTSGFELIRGATTVVFGPNGAGKTTLLRELAAELGVEAAYQPQQPYLFRGLAGTNLGMGLSDERAGLAGQYARRFGLEELLASPASFLSGGERARLALARVLARPEQVVLLDEPLAAVDGADRSTLIATIREATSYRTAVIVTHEVEQVVALGDQMAVMMAGAVVQQGTVAEVMAAPATESVARSVGVTNVIDAEVRTVGEATVTTVASGVTVIGSSDGDPSGQVRVLIPAESVTLLAPDAAPDSARNHWVGTISDMHPMGRLVEVTIDIGFPLRAIVTPGAVDSLGLRIGLAVTAAAKASAISIVGR